MKMLKQSHMNCLHEDRDLHIEIGDSKDISIFQPQVKLMKWDNEVNFSVRLVDDNTGSFIKKDEKVIYDKPDIKVEYYEAENAHKMVWFLKRKTQI